MLRITMNKSADGAKKYYCEKYYKEGQSGEMEYYTEGELHIGRWGGKAAAKLGLTGDIVSRDFASMCDNINPRTSKRLTGRNDTDRTVGYDFTFSANKSISLAYTFGQYKDKMAILDAFHRSVRETMSEIETGMQARVRAKGKNENRMTGNIAYGEFTHFTTRPIDGVPDPHLHSHCFIFNSTFDEHEQKWKAGDFKQLKQDAPYYEAIFQSKFARNLQAAGYAITRSKSGFELDGVEAAAIEKFSRRTKEIEDYAKAHSITDAEKKSQVGAKTREAKRAPLSVEKQETAWLSRLSDAELVAFEQLRKDGIDFREAHTNDKAALEALQFSLSHHLERKSVASDKAVLASAIKVSIGKATPEQLREQFDKDINILSADKQLRTFITTREALQEEKRLIQHCLDAKNKYRPIHEGYVPQNPLLNEQQREAVRHALSSTDGISIITGKAGTGKTTLMKEVKEGIHAAGKSIYSFAPSSEASRGVQRSEGFENAETVAKLIQDKMLQLKLKQQVIWIDEAGMLSNRDMNHILAIAEAQNARIILSGDTKQHTSVERGDALRIVESEAGIKPVTVNKIQRQKNKEYREAVKSLSAGDVEKGFKQLEHIGAIHEIADSGDRIKTIAADYCDSAYPSDTRPAREVLVIAPTHAEGDVVTQEIRQNLKDKNRIGQEDREFQVLKNLQLTEAEKQQPESYKQGNMLVFFQNAKGVKAGNKLEVMTAEGPALQAIDAQGLPYNIPLTEADKFSVFETRNIHVTQGDKIRITANGQSNDGKHLFNGSTFNIQGFDKEGNIELSNGAILPPDFGHFNFGYVSTSHGSQGKTADKVIVSQSSATFRASSMEQFYVSVSRGKEAVSIYTDDKAHLKDAVSQSTERTSATELMAMRQQQAQEINRVSQFKKWQEQPVETYEQVQEKTR